MLLFQPFQSPCIFLHAFWPLQSATTIHRWFILPFCFTSLKTPIDPLKHLYSITLFLQISLMGTSIHCHSSNGGRRICLCPHIHGHYWSECITVVCLQPLNEWDLLALVVCWEDGAVKFKHYTLYGSLLCALPYMGSACPLTPVMNAMCSGDPSASFPAASRNSCFLARGFSEVVSDPVETRSATLFHVHTVRESELNPIGQ